MNAVCVACGLEMRCALNGAILVGEQGAKAGDIYYCQGCGREIMTGFSESWLNVQYHRGHNDPDRFVHLASPGEATATLTLEFGEADA